LSFWAVKAWERRVWCIEYVNSIYTFKTYILIVYYQYIHNTPPPPVPSTLGATFTPHHTTDSVSATPLRLQLWDTAGQERFRSLSRLYYRGAQACILCYSVTSLQSFNAMGLWLRELRKEAGEGLIIHVVGTKADVVAIDPSRREVPFERCIAFVAENLFPGATSTPPPTAGQWDAAGGFDWSNSNSNSHAGGGNAISDGGRSFEAAKSPNLKSNRSSGFWGQDVGWDCCHEVSAETGEGVEEVFRVVVRKLVEAARRKEEADGMSLNAIATPGFRSTPGYGARSGEGDDYFGGAHARPGGSFRVGRDRRSWLGLGVDWTQGAPTTPGVDVGQVGGSGAPRKGRCC
jgi:small GTP-binding protein